MKRYQITVVVAGSAFVLAAATISTAVADPQTAGQTTAQAGEGELGEVVVTARKSTERLQDVPLAITAISQESLDVGHEVGLEDVAKLTPGLKFTSFLDSVNGNVTIRGLQQENVQNGVGNVGVFLDGIYLQRGFMVDSGLGDYERIEVIKGPQSALYGENTFAGALSYVTRQPTDEFKLDASATEGNGNLSEAKIGVGGPIVKGILDGRLYAAESDFNGVLANNFPGATGDSQYFGGHKWQNYSGSLKFTPIEQLEVDGFYNYSKRYYQIQPFYTIDGTSAEDHLNCGNPTSGGRPYSLWCGSLPTNPAAFRTGVGTPPPGLSFQPQPGTNTLDEVGKVAAIYKLTDSFTLNYTYGNTRGQSLEQSSFATDPTNPFLAVQREGGVLTYDSNELRLVYSGPGPLTGQVGYFYSAATDHEAFGLLFTAGDAPYLSKTNNPISIAGEAIPFNNYIQKYKTSSPFGQVNYKFLDDKANLSAEVRYTTTKLSDQDLLAEQEAGGGLPILQATYHNVTPRLTADYKLTPDELAYVSAARGAKAGGFNGYVASTTTLLASQQAFGEENNWTYEVGWKASYLEHTLIVDADFFYVDWKNKQEAVVPSNFNAPPVNSQSLGVVPQIYENVGNAYSYGFELTTAWKPTSYLNVNWALSLQDPRYAAGSKALAFTAVCDNKVCSGLGNISGNLIAQVSQVTTDVAVEYHNHLFDGQYFIGFDESYRGRQEADDVNVAQIAAFWLTDAHATFQKDQWKLSLWGKNLFDGRYIDSSFVIPSIYQYNANYIEPRTYGATVSVSF